jgi:hypothetical protein
MAENDWLKEENEELKLHNESLLGKNKQLMSKLFACKANLMKGDELKEKMTKANEAFTSLPPIHKEVNKESILQMVASWIIFIMRTIVWKTQKLTWLQVISEVLYQRELFGNLVTEKVLREVTKHYC